MMYHIDQINNGLCGFGEKYFIELLKETLYAPSLDSFYCPSFSDFLH